MKMEGRIASLALPSDSDARTVLLYTGVTVSCEA